MFHVVFASTDNNHLAVSTSIVFELLGVEDHICGFHDHSLGIWVDLSPIRSTIPE